MAAIVKKKLFITVRHVDIEQMSLDVVTLKKTNKAEIVHITQPPSCDSNTTSPLDYNPELH